MRNRKGQAAMEFLMTYGWAILVVLAAIGALAYFGILSPDRWLPTKCTMTGGFSCLEHKVSTGDTNQIFFRLQNNLGADLQYANLSINSSDCTYSVSSPAGSADNIPLGDLQNGAEASVTIDCTETFTQNQRTRMRLEVEYLKSGETLPHTATGELSSKAEE